MAGAEATQGWGRKGRGLNTAGEGGEGPVRWSLPHEEQGPQAVKEVIWNPGDIHKDQRDSLLSYTREKSQDR